MPSGSNDLEIGKEVNSIKIESQSGNSIKSFSKDQPIVINFWDTNDPLSRVRTQQLCANLRDKDNISVINIFSGDDIKLAEDILRIDSIDGANIINLNKNDISAEVFKNFQTDSGNRSFLLDENGILKAIMPQLQDFENIL